MISVIKCVKTDIQTKYAYERSFKYVVHCFLKGVGFFDFEIKATFEPDSAPDGLDTWIMEYKFDQSALAAMSLDRSFLENLIDPVEYESGLSDFDHWLDEELIREPVAVDAVTWRLIDMSRQRNNKL